MWPPRERNAVELLEMPGRSWEQVAGNLDDMERLLRLLAVDRVVWSHLRRIEPPSGRSLRVLDLATGSGWLPRALVARACLEGRGLEVVGVDRDPQIVGLARERSAGEPALQFCQADARELAPSWGAFDAVTCTMTLHHLAADEVVRLLAAMAAVAAHSWLSCDLLRGPGALGLAWLGTRLTSRNAFTLHDGPLSVRRAFTLPELAELGRRSGAPGVRVVRRAGIWAEISGRGMQGVTAGGP
jgi:SAM-dependent methyltransferase